MLVVLDEGGGLLQVLPGEVIPELLDELGDHGDAIFADNDAFHFNGSNLGIPVMCSNVSYRDALGGVGVEDFFHEFFEVEGEGGGDGVVAGENFLVELVCVRILERKISASHGVENDTAGPDIRGEAVVLLAGYHFRRCVAGTTARRLKNTIVRVGI